MARSADNLIHIKTPAEYRRHMKESVAIHPMFQSGWTFGDNDLLKHRYGLSFDPIATLVETGSASNMIHSGWDLMWHETTKDSHGDPIAWLQSSLDSGDPLLEKAWAAVVSLELTSQLKRNR